MPHPSVTTDKFLEEFKDVWTIIDNTDDAISIETVLPRTLLNARRNIRTSEHVTIVCTPFSLLCYVGCYTPAQKEKCKHRIQRLIRHPYVDVNYCSYHPYGLLGSQIDVLASEFQAGAANIAFLDDHEWCRIKVKHLISHPKLNIIKPAEIIGLLCDYVPDATMTTPYHELFTTVLHHKHMSISGIVRFKGDNPLYVACQHKNIEALKVLLAHPHFNAFDSVFFDAFDVANRGDPNPAVYDILKLLLTTTTFLTRQMLPLGAKIQVRKLLLDFCHKQQLTCLTLLLEERPDLDISFQSSHALGDTRASVLYTLCAGIPPVSSHDVLPYIRQLLKHQNVSVNKPYNRRSPLMAAIKSENIGAVKALLAHPDIRVDERGVDGEVASHCAANCGNVEIMRLLWEKDANIIKMKDYSDLTPLDIALMYKNSEMESFLLERLDERDIPIATAIRGGMTDLVGRCIEHKQKDTDWDINADIGNGETLLRACLEDCFINRDNILSVLLHHKADPNIAIKMDPYDTSLGKAIQMGDENIVEIFIKAGATVDLPYRPPTGGSYTYPIHDAASGGNVRIAQLLVQENADVNIGFTTPLHCAVAHLHKDMVEYLLKENADVNARNWDEETPLHTVALQNCDNETKKADSKDVAQTLIQYNASVNTEDTSHATPLQAAAQKGNNAIITLLVDNNASTRIDAPGSYGQTPLMSALAHHNEESAILLIDIQADVNVHNENYDESPLQYAKNFWNDDARIIQKLIAEGAEI